MNHVQLQSNPTNVQEKAFTFFIVPFYYDGTWADVHKRLDRWQPITENLYKEDVLYPYIMDMFNYESAEGKSRLMIYKFQTKDKGGDSEMFVDRVLGKMQIAAIGKNSSEKKNPQQIPFTLLNENNFAPHIFISPTAKIGILTFSIEIEGSNTIGQQIAINYWFHKRNEVDKYQCICLKPDDKEENTISQNNNNITSVIPDLWKLNQKKTRQDVDYVCWNINDFVDCIMRTMGKPQDKEERIKYFSTSRMHLFSFHSIIDLDNNINCDEINHNLLRLARAVESNYMLPFEQLQEQNTILKTYENIFFASSIEGASMMCIGKKGNESFISQIHNKFNRQYLLIYLLVLIQRYTLQSLESKMIDFEGSDKQSDDKLWSLIDVICRIKTHCYYTDVSIYSHHSQFYHLCCKNQHIPETFEEISEKVELLKLTTDRVIQKSQQKAERLQKLLNIIVAILTIAQVMQAVYELSTAEKDITLALTAGKLCFLLIIIAYLWSYFKDFFFKR